MTERNKLRLKHRWVSGVVVATMLILAPWVIRDAYIIHLLILVGIYILLASSLNVSVGMAGLLNLGHAAFYGIGAYTGAILSTRGVGDRPVPFWLGLIIAFVLTGLGGAALGVPSLRLRGHYFAIASLGFGEIARSLMLNMVSITNGPFGIKAIPSPKIGPLSFSGREMYYYLVLAVVVGSLLAVRNLLGSRFGWFLSAVREDEIVASALGVDVFKTKILALAVSSSFAGVAGCLYAHYVSYISPSNFTLDESILVLCMVVLGGRGTFWGPILGAGLLTVIPELLRGIAQYRLLVYGIALALLMAYRPEGVIGRK